VFLELGILIALTTIIAILVKVLRQPLIIGYILTGIIAGPYLLNLIRSDEIINIFSEIGIALLLFIVGIHLNPRVIKEVGLISLITGVGQVLFTSLIGFIIGISLGFNVIESIFISIAFAFSSTIIIMKLLTDKGDTEKLYGKIAIGFLIVQDFIAIIILMVITTLSGDFTLGSFASQILITGTILLILLVLASIYVLPPVTKIIAKSQELLLLFSISWALALASLFYYLGFSMEIGALLAGITLSMSPYRYEIGFKLRPIRDFFIVLFFIFLGYQMPFESINEMIIPIIVFSVFILIGNPLIVIILMGLMGYTKRNSFLAGLTVAQISEFSIIVIGMAMKYYHNSIEKDILLLTTGVALITIAGSSYMIIYGQKIYPYVSKFLTVFEKKGKKKDEHKLYGDESHDIILFGYDRIGLNLMESFKKLKSKFLIIDHNPDRILELAKQNIDARYGDATDVELLNDLNFKKAKMIISTITDFETNLLITTKAREKNNDLIIIVVSHSIDNSIELYTKGATYVIMPHFLGGSHASTLIEKYMFDPDKFIKEKIEHIEHLKNRKQKGQDHPKHK
jgi:Kef-type K+ transport system membrane component KefB/Trk K+ transport system NAD-binding subunit